MEQNSQSQQHTVIEKTIIVKRRTNGLGTAGFVLSIVGFCFFWIFPVYAILTFLGFLFSFIGIFRAPRGLAIAGLVISLLLPCLLSACGTAIFAGLNNM